MSLVPSLLQAILKVDGEALVMHAGEKPYVVAPSGQIELASRGLTLEAVDGIVGQLLPVELQRALDEFGAVQYELPAAPEFPGEHFTVVAARGGAEGGARTPPPESFPPPAPGGGVCGPPPGGGACPPCRCRRCAPGDAHPRSSRPTLRPRSARGPRRKTGDARPSGKGRSP